MTPEQFMQEGVRAGYPSVVFQQTGAAFLGTVIDKADVVFTQDDGDDEKTPKLVVNMRCDAVQGNITTKVKINGVEQEVIPTVGENYSFWLKKYSSMLRAVNEAVMNKGISTGVPQQQGRLMIQMVGVGERKKPQFSPPKMFVAQYEAAPQGIEAAALLGMGVQAQPQAPQQPVYAPQPPQQPMMAPTPQYAPQPMQPMAPQQPMMPQQPPAQPGFGNLLG